jgi:L-alanine-DL-glutamate epimerase-like enolase superfamily enzyme
LFTKWGFREVLEKQAAVILQPDLSHAGGILEVKKIAAMAECYYAAIAPHCPLGPIALAACLQLDACIPNFLVQEHVTTGEGYLKQPFVIQMAISTCRRDLDWVSKWMKGYCRTNCTTAHGKHLVCGILMAR